MTRIQDPLRFSIFVAIMIAFGYSPALAKPRALLEVTKARTIRLAESRAGEPSLGVSGSFAAIGGGEGSGPLVTTIHLADETSTGTTFSAVDEDLTSGVNVAAADLEDDGEIEVITGPGAGSPPRVRIFSATGFEKSSFDAFDPTFVGGVTVAAGDIDGDGKLEIITSSNGVVRARNATTLRVVFQVQPYGEAFTGGIALSSGDLDGDGTDEVITVPSTGAGALKVFDSEEQRLQLFPFGSNFSGGVSVAAGDLDGDGRAEIVTSARSGKPRVRIFEEDGREMLTFRPFHPSYRGGLTVAVGDVNGDGLADIAVGGKLSRGRRKRKTVSDGLEIYLVRPGITRNPKGPKEPKGPKVKAPKRPERPK